MDVRSQTRIFIKFDLIKSYIAPLPTPFCFTHYWLVDIIGLSPEAWITLIRTLLGLFSASSSPLSSYIT